MITRKSMVGIYETWLKEFELDPEEHAISNYKEERQRLYQITTSDGTTPIGSNWHTCKELYDILKAICYFNVYQKRGF